MKKTVGIAAMLSCAVSLAGSDLAAAAPGAGREPTTQSKRAKKDFGEMSMMLGDVEWNGTSARAELKERTGSLAINGARMDGPLRSKVRQSLDLYLPEFHGLGTYTANPGSMFLVVGIALGEESDAQMDVAMREALTKAKHLQLEGAEVVVESASDTEVVGSFSFSEARTPVTDGRFRALYRKKK